MLSFVVKDDIERVVRQVASRVERQVPFATAKALTRTAQSVRDEERAHMASVFDRPTPWTLNSLFVRSATKANLQAEVSFKEPGSKGTDPSRVLRHHIRGGSREWKRFELALKRIGVLLPTWAAVPGEGAKMDAFGNMSRGQIVQLLSYLQAFGEQGYRANITERGRSRLARRGRTEGGYSRIGGVEYFVSRGPGQWFGAGSWKHGRVQHLAPGVWARSGMWGGNIKPVLMFVPMPSYTARFKFYEVAQRTVSERFPVEFEQALRSAMETAR